MTTILIGAVCLLIGTLIGITIGSHLSGRPTGRLSDRPQVPIRVSDEALRVVLALIHRDVGSPADRPSESVSAKIIRSEIMDGRS